MLSAITYYYYFQLCLNSLFFQSLLQARPRPYRSSKATRSMSWRLLLRDINRPDDLPVTQPTVSMHWMYPGFLDNGCKSSLWCEVTISKAVCFTGVMNVYVGVLWRLNLLRRVWFAAWVQTHQCHVGLFTFEFRLTFDAQHLVTWLSSSFARASIITLLPTNVHPSFRV